MSTIKFKTLWELFFVFFKAGTFTFAGGLAMLPVIEKDVVEKYKLLTRENFLEFATLAQTLPGVIAVNCACFVGKRAAGLAGMLVAVLGATLSAFVLMLLATILLQSVPMQGAVVGAFRGIRAASAALVLSAAFTLGRYSVKDAFSVAVMVLAFGLVFLADVNILFVIIGAGLIGYLRHRLTVRKAKV
ncbi:MAG TPA: chromate transporter [Clostridiales bacterium]|nr:chromate transporter [Clostridiales bacterium]